MLKTEHKHLKWVIINLLSTGNQWETFQIILFSRKHPSDNKTTYSTKITRHQWHQANKNTFLYIQNKRLTCHNAHQVQCIQNPFRHFTVSIVQWHHDTQTNNRDLSSEHHEHQHQAQFSVFKAALLNISLSQVVKQQKHDSKRFEFHVKNPEKKRIIYNNKIMITQQKDNKSKNIQLHRMKEIKRKS